VRSERWQQVEAVFQTALALGGDERKRYLDNTCLGDGELRQEVESLLTAYEKTGTFMNVPAHEVAAQLIAGYRPTLLVSGEPVDGCVFFDTKGSKGASPEHELKPAAKSGRRLWLLWLFFSLMLVNAAFLAFVNLKFFSSYNSDVEVFTRQQNGFAVVTLVTHRQTDSPLQVGDEIIAVNGCSASDGIGVCELLA